jgi:GGDEF domain-containing protein
MNILHRDSRSILPRVESLHLFSRVIIIVGIIAYLFFGPLAKQNQNPLYIILGIELLLLGLTWALFSRTQADYTNTYLFTIVLDILLISGLTRYTGGTVSEFYVFYFLSVSLGAYIMSSTATMILAGVVSTMYTAGNLDTLGQIGPLNLTLRIILIWFYAMTVNYIAEYIRRSEGRLLKLFNTLNRRTSELEKIHAQLEMVYENSRILAGMLDFNQIIEEILKISEKVLDYPALGIMLIGPGGSLIYRGRLVGGNRNTKLRAAGRTSMELAYRVADVGEPVRAVDLSRRTDYEPLLKSARSAMLVPMVTYGKTTGLLLAESPRKGAFEERDEQFLSVLARSAAMALENAILHRKMEELTIIDDLTGVHNYRYFSEKIKEEKRRAVRYELPISLIMLDIDWFKNFNDNYGHEVGNQVLIRLVDVIKQCIRDVDILCRYGGEEFIIILPQTVEREAFRIAQRIRDSWRS